MNKKITKNKFQPRIYCNMITSLLLTSSSFHGLPVSITHVSVGSLFGIGTTTKKANHKVIGKIILAWLLTLPIAAFMQCDYFKSIRNNSVKIITFILSILNQPYFIFNG